MLTSKTPREVYTISFGFSANMASISSASCTVTLLRGTDASPSNVLNGSAIISGTNVLQKIKGGVKGCKYGIVCQATDGTNIFERADAFEVVENFNV